MEIKHFCARRFNNLKLCSDNLLVINFSKETILQNNVESIDFTNIIEGNPQKNIKLPYPYHFFDINCKNLIMNKLKNNNYSKIYCVCDAGLCRSFSVAICILNIYSGDITKYIFENNCLPDKNIITILQNNEFYEKVLNIFNTKKDTYDDLFDNLF